MYLFKVMIKECLQSIRHLKVMLIMTIMPLLIILIMGIAISGAFTQSDVDISDITVDYLRVGNTNELSASFETVLKGFLDQDKINYITSLEKGMLSVRSRDTGAFIVLDTGNSKVEFFYNDEFSVEASIVELAVKNFVRQYNVAYQTRALPVELSSDIVKKEYVGTSSDTSAMDYFGVAMSILFVFYGIPMAMSSVIKEKKKGTMNRILLTPASKTDFLFGKVFGNLVISLLQITFLMVGTIIFFNVNWGSVISAWLMLVTMVFFTVSLGVSLGFLFDSEEKAMGVIHVLIVAFGMFGGSYMPLRDLGTFGQVGKFFSPIWWNMNGLLDMIYGNSNTMLYKAVIINLVGAFILISITAYFTNRRKVVYG